MAAAVALGAVTLSGASADATISQTVVASADAYVSSRESSANLGAEPELRIDSAPNENSAARVARSYVRFDIPVSWEPIARATLRVYATNGDHGGFTVGRVADTWDEQTITWSNAPPQSAGPTIASGPFAAGDWVSVDVTPLVTGSGSTSFALIGSTPSPMALGSREQGQTVAPRLSIETLATAPVNQALPTISGTPQEGKPLSAAAGTWSGTAPISYAYQWQRCDAAGGGCVQLPSATTTTYTPTGAVVGSTLRVVVTASNSAGSSGAGSEPTPLVVAAPGETSPPSAPADLTSSADQSSITLTWSASSDNVAVTGYDLFLKGAKVASTAATNYRFGGLKCGTGYTIGVAAYDAAGNRSSTSALASATAACADTSPPDTSPPSVPSNLQVGAADQSSITLTWSASSDNVAVTGYDLFLNGAKVASTAATNYRFGGLKCGTGYTIGVAAYDAAGNRSGQSEVVAATGPCPDTSAPTAPTGVVVTAASSTSVSILWSPAFDNVGVSGYHLFLNGSKIGSTPLTNYIFGGLTCATSYSVGIEAYDAAGNVSARLTMTAATSACQGSSTGVAPRFRYIFHSGSDQAGAAALGFNLLDVDTKSEADALPAGTQGLYWLGDYLNAPTCDWEQSDATIAAKVRAGVGDPKIWGYNFSNEPDPYGCPNAVSQHRQRAALIRSIDPAKATFISLDMNWRDQALKQIPLWVGVTDYTGLNPYVCFVGQPACDFAWIDQVIHAADNAGVAYFGHVQAFQANEWRWPTADELQHMLGQWAASKQKGYSLFSWNYGAQSLSSQPALMDVLKRFNGSASGSTPGDTTAPSVPTGLSKAASTGTTVSLSWNASSDNVDVAGYGVYRNGMLVATTSGTSYTVDALTCGTSYTFAVDAYDATGNRSAKASLTAATGSCTDMVAPTAPDAPIVTGTTPTSIALFWGPSIDNVGVAGYDVYVNGSKVGSTAALSYTFGGLSCDTSYALGVEAYDVAGNRSPRASLVATTSACPDIQAPSAPSNLTNTGASETSLSLSWSASTDNVGVAGYDVYRNGGKLGSTASTSYTFSGLACGTNYTLGVAAYDTSGNHSAVVSVSAATSACSSASDQVIAAAGDICGSPTDCAPTAKLLDQLNPDAVLTLGDNAYEDGSLSQYLSEYDPNWGRQNAKVYPSPGNHEFHIANAQGYRDYFGARAPALWYSYDLGAWHVVSLAGDVGVSASAGSPQETWLKQDLAAHPSQCILAYWHEPRWSSGDVHRNDSGVAAFWSDLYVAGADVVLNGHDHNYQRFPPLNPSGQPDTNGIREFVVGTGGASHYGFTASSPAPEVRNGTDFGVLKLTLHAGSYDFEFVPVAGSTFADSGSGTCHGTTQAFTSPHQTEFGFMTFARIWLKDILYSKSGLLDMLKRLNLLRLDQ